MLTKSEIKMIVGEQICNMLQNNVVFGWGFESFIGWLEDGDIFANADDHMTDEEIEQIMEYAREVAPLVDNLAWKIAPEIED